LPTGWAFLFSLVSFIKKGDKCNDEAAKGYEQAQYSNDNHTTPVVGAFLTILA